MSQIFTCAFLFCILAFLPALKANNHIDALKTLLNASKANSLFFDNVIKMRMYQNTLSPEKQKNRDLCSDNEQSTLQILEHNIKTTQNMLNLTNENLTNELYKVQILPFFNKEKNILELRILKQHASEINSDKPTMSLDTGMEASFPISNMSSELNRKLLEFLAQDSKNRFENGIYYFTKEQLTALVSNLELLVNNQEKTSNPIPNHFKTSAKLTVEKLNALKKCKKMLNCIF